MVLLDEIEKAHPEVFNMLLQIMEDGHLTDAKGRRVDFRNTVIIMTSNVGAKSLLKDTTLGFRPTSTSADLERDRQYDRMKDKVLEQLKTQFRPGVPQSRRLVRGLPVAQRRGGSGRSWTCCWPGSGSSSASSRSILEITQEAKDHIIKIGYDVDYGARPLRRVIQTMVEDPLAEALLLGTYTSGQTIVVDRSPDAGLTIAAVAEKTPVEAL